MLILPVLYVIYLRWVAHSLSLLRAETHKEWHRPPLWPTVMQITWNVAESVISRKPQLLKGNGVFSCRQTNISRVLFISSPWLAHTRTNRIFSICEETAKTTGIFHKLQNFRLLKESVAFISILKTYPQHSLAHWFIHFFVRSFFLDFDWVSAVQITSFICAVWNIEVSCR